MTGHNVIHTIGYDAFGCPPSSTRSRPASTPALTTESNIATMRRQLRRLGLAHDPAGRSPPSTRATTAGRSGSSCRSSTPGTTPTPTAPGPSPTWWPSWRPAPAGPARAPTPTGRPWAELSPTERRVVVDNHRLAYVDEAPVNWCPGLGTVLANEEVTAEGARLRQLPGVPPAAEAVDDADHRLRRPAARRPRPAGLAGRHQADAAQLDRPVRGRHIDLPIPGGTRHRGFTTRPDTTFGATYMVLAPEHPLVDQLTASDWPDGVTRPGRGRRLARGGGGGLPSPGHGAVRGGAPGRVPQKTGVFLGTYAVNPATGERSRCSSPTTC